MILPDTLTEAIRALRASKLRSLLSTLGVAIGSACVVLVVTISLSAKSYITGVIEAIGSNLVYAEYVRGEASPPLADFLSPADLEAIRPSIPQVKQVAGTYTRHLKVAARAKEIPVTLVGVTGGFQEIRRLIVLRGRYLDEEDIESYSKVCLLTKDLAKRLFSTDDPVGRTVRVGELIFTVIGVFRERGSTFGESDIQRESLLMPFSLTKQYTGASVLLIIYAQANRAEDVPLVTQELGDLLRSRHRPGVKYNVQNLGSILDAARNISLALSIVLRIIGLITLTIGGVNIMNIMPVTVTERTREIGLRKAVGARRLDIRYQFLLEAVMISTFGAMAGIVVGLPSPFWPSRSCQATSASGSHGSPS
jgi:putative ABC transport system permease protein